MSSDVDWDILLQQEKDEPSEGWMPEAPQTSEEMREEDSEFNQFSEQELVVGFGQLEHIAFGPPGTFVGGKRSKVEQVLQIQTVGKEKLYIQKLIVELGKRIESKKEIEHYTTLVQNVPRFWTKNAVAMAAAIFMIDKLHGTKLTQEKLTKYSQDTEIGKADLFRYYRLLKEYIEK